MARAPGHAGRSRDDGACTALLLGSVDAPETGLRPALARLTLAIGRRRDETPPSCAIAANLRPMRQREIEPGAHRGALRIVALRGRRTRAVGIDLGGGLVACIGEA